MTAGIRNTRFALSALLLLATVAAHAAAPPNIVMIVVDDLPDDMCNFIGEGGGRNLTPNIDRLSSEGLVMTRMHSPSPICTPSRFAILSGRYPSRASNPEFVSTTRRFGQTSVQFNTHLTPGDDCLPKRLQQAGYTTAAVGKNHVIEVEDYQRLPYKASIDSKEAQQTLADNAAALQQAYRDAGFDYAERLYFGNPDADGVRALAMHNQDWITEGAVEFLRQEHQKPFFLYFATTIPHGPFEDDRSWNADRRVTPEGVLESTPTVHSTAASLERRVREANADGWGRKPLLWLDDALGVLMQQLEAQGLADNTIVLFMSDHGTRAKGSVYRQGTRTPFFAWKRGGFGAARSDALASLIDLAPTVLEWAGARTDSGMDGVSLTPVFNGERQSVRDSLYFEIGFTRAVQKDGFKYVAVRYPEIAIEMPMDERKRILDKNNEVLKMRGRPVATSDPSTPFSHLSLIPGGNDAERVSIEGHPAYFEADQLYDLSKDPRERENLADDPAYAETLAELKQLLGHYVAELPGTFAEFGREESL